MTDWGNGAEIVSAIGTVAAAGAAGWAAWKASAAAKATGATLELEQGRDDRQLKDAARAQARSVSAWIDITVPVQDIDPSERLVWWEAQVVVDNASPEPIYEVAVLLHLHDRPVLRELLRFPVIPPRAVRRHPLVPWDLREDREAVLHNDGDVRVEPTPVQPNIGGMLVRTAFRDSDSRRWVRTSSGVLEATDRQHSDDAAKDHPAGSGRRWEAGRPEDW